MIALISILALALLGLIWWWVFHPHDAGHRTARGEQLPLFTTRSPGRGVSIVIPSLRRGGVPLSTAPAAFAAAAPAAPATNPPASVPAEAQASRSDTVVATERYFTTVPYVEPEAARQRERPARTGNGTGNGRRAAELRDLPAPSPSTSAGSLDHVAPPPYTAKRAAPAASPAVDPAEAEAARWGPPPERDPTGTVQFLPGRLEVVQGRTMEGQEIRFVRPDRVGERAVVTFGRVEGAPYKHVQLKVPTVSRLHARMALEPGSSSWTLENLSSTNPVSINGADLVPGDAPVALSDGDRVEMGEVVFRFRER